MSLSFCGKEFRGKFTRTSATGAERAVALAAHGANTNHLAVDIFRGVGVDVASAAAAMGNFGGRHFR
jgi:hypothetical protein